MPFMTTQELHTQRRFIKENIRALVEAMPGLLPLSRQRAANTINNLQIQLDSINAELAMSGAE